MQTTPRVRFAPSPTGYLHVGGARTALFNWLYAKQIGGVFALRIEDTDRERSSSEMTEAILDGMRWLGLDWDEGPVHQADGFDRHRHAVQRLLERRRAYRCFCSPEELQARRDASGEVPEGWRYDRLCLALDPVESARRAEAGEPHTVRFLVPEGETTWDDLVHGDTRFRNEDIEDFIILRSDGTPIYNLAVTSDDIEMDITHVIRGDDHLSNTPKQILLYRALEAEVPVFAHLPMILGPDGKRLSKRHGATAVGEYQDQGILPQALVNFLALLGWNPGDDTEVMTTDQLIARFSIERVNKKSAVFDPEKLEWMNLQHMMMLSGEELLDLAAPGLVEQGLASPEELVDRRGWFAALMELLRPRSRRVGDLVRQAGPFLVPHVEYDPEAVAKQWKNRDEAVQRLAEARRTLQAVEPWEPDAIEAALRRGADEAGVAFGKLVHPLRIALMGSSASPGIDQVITLLGRDAVLRRTDAAAEWLRGGGAGGQAR
jgi:glutamyl-tRNA synthetase